MITSEHGTRSRYTAGCTCGLCRAAHSDYQRERRATTLDYHRSPAARSLIALGYAYTRELDAFVVRRPDGAKVLSRASAKAAWSAAATTQRVAM